MSDWYMGKLARQDQDVADAYAQQEEMQRRAYAFPKDAIELPPQQKGMMQTLREQPWFYPSAPQAPGAIADQAGYAPTQTGWMRNVNAVRPISGEGRTESEESRAAYNDPYLGALELGLTAVPFSKPLRTGAIAGGALLAGTGTAEAGPRKSAGDVIKGFVRGTQPAAKEAPMSSLAEFYPSMRRSDQWITSEAPLQRPHPIERYVTDPRQVFSPGIYKDPRVIAREAAENVAPEHPALKKLFGVTRDDLYEIGERGARKGNIEPSFQTKPGATGSYMSENIMTPANAQRQIDVLAEAEKYPELVKGMDAWYVMDPAFQQMVKLVGYEQAVKDYRRLNTVMPMFSPATDVNKEINRGSAANMMIQRGQWPTFVRHGGTAVEDRGPRFPSILRDVVPHPYHSTAHTGPVSRYLERGDPGDMQSVKVPLYMQASGVPETGFQTKLPIPDAHITRSAGMADVRKGAKPGVSMKTPEYMQWGPWYRENVATPMGIEAVPAQARQWGVYAPQTGVNTAIGAPKLELIAQRIWEKAETKNIDPKKLRDDFLLGKDYAVKLIGVPVAGAAAARAARMGDTADQSEYRQ